MARSDLDRFAKALADAGRDLRAHRDPMREPLARSDFAGSSLNFEIFLRRERPDLVVPERECVLITGIGFEPEPTWRGANPQDLPGNHSTRRRPQHVARLPGGLRQKRLR
jgi:hypothetical protein